jgi:nuclear pore complex protein Nup62
MGQWGGPTRVYWNFIVVMTKCVHLLVYIITIAHYNLHDVLRQVVLCMYVLCVYVYVCVYVCMCIYVCVYVCMCICMYVYICMYVLCTYVYIEMYSSLYNLPWRPWRGTEMQLYSFFNLGTRWGGQRHAPAALPLGNKPYSHCIGNWVGPRAYLDACVKSHPPTGIRSPHCPACNESILTHTHTHVCMYIYIYIYIYIYMSISR